MEGLMVPRTIFPERNERLFSSFFRFSFVASVLSLYLLFAVIYAGISFSVQKIFCLPG